MAAGCLEILKNDAPGNAINYQVMNNDQKPVRLISGDSEQDDPDQGSSRQIETGLSRRRRTFDLASRIRFLCDLNHREDIVLLEVGIVLLPPGIAPRVAHSQGIVVLNNRL